MVYLDHNATTPLLPAVRTALAEWLDGGLGNPSSVHRPGARARAAVEKARRTVASAVGAQPSEIVFTSGGTESNNLALFGLLVGDARCHVVASPIEHSSVIAPLQVLARQGVDITWLPVDVYGRVDPAVVHQALRPNTALVTVGWANNEIGTVQPIEEIAGLCRAHGALLHVDAVQALGKVAMAVRGLDLCAFSAHKIGGPQGVGALYVRRGITLTPRLFGGNQERGLRSGSENVAGIVGFGVAVGAIDPARYGRLQTVRERLWRGLEATGTVRRNSPVAACLPNTLHVSFSGVSGEALVAALDLEGIAVSAGSACAAGAAEPSHVLRACGRDEAEARECVRFSLGSETTAAEIDMTIEAVGRVMLRVQSVRQRAVAHA